MGDACSSRPVWRSRSARWGSRPAEVEPAVGLGEAFGVDGGNFQEGGARGAAAAQAQNEGWRVGSAGVGEAG